MRKTEQLLAMGYKLEDLGKLDLLDIFPHETKIPEDVYASLLGGLVPRCHLRWVENINVPGTPYERNLETIYVTGLNLSRRLGVTDDFEEEVLTLREAYERNEEIVAYEMFKYGMKYQKMLDTETTDNNPDRIP